MEGRLRLAKILNNRTLLFVPRRGVLLAIRPREAIVGPSIAPEAARRAARGSGSRGEYPSRSTIQLLPRPARGRHQLKPTREAYDRAVRQPS